MSQEFQHQQEVPGQRSAGTSQYGSTPSGTGMEMGSRMGAQSGRGMNQGTGSEMGQGTGSEMAGQHGGMGSQMGGQTMGMRLSDVETPQQRTAVEDVTRAIQVCGWCADQCVQEADPGMIECIRLCEDVTELGETVLALLPRNSRHTDQVLQAFQQAVQACAQECGRHHHAHCQECAEVLGYTAESIQQLYGAYDQQGGMGGQQGSMASQQGGTTGQQGGMGGGQTTPW